MVPPAMMAAMLIKVPSPGISSPHKLNALSIADWKLFKQKLRIILNFFTQVGGNLVYVLVAPAGQVDHYDLIRRHLRHHLDGLG